MLQCVWQSGLRFVFRRRFVMTTTAMSTTAKTSVGLNVGELSYPRIFAISDLHVDYKDNREFVDSWSPTDYKNDVLIVAGDVTDNLDLLEKTLRSLQEKFRQVFYVSGNHELWIRGTTDPKEDSVAKFHRILEMCQKIGVCCSPQEIQVSLEQAIQIVPLFSWYSKPEEDPHDSLHLKPPPHIIENVQYNEQVWMDNHLCKWPDLNGVTPAMYFANLNDAVRKDCKENSLVITFSHFLPRSDLIPANESETDKVTQERLALGLGEAPKSQSSVKGFNFTRYAGSKILERQLREAGSCLHVYGHQHRNRDRVIDGIRYVSHCLGNPQEQKGGWVWGIRHWKGPKQIWPSTEG